MMALMCFFLCTDVKSFVLVKEVVQRTCSKRAGQYTEMILPCEIPQLDIPDVGRNHIQKKFQ